MIEVTQIRKSYGKKKVLSDITFQVKPGECVAIAGKNGCGKSTLMQIMAGILKAVNYAILEKKQPTKAVHFVGFAVMCRRKIR